MTPVGRGCDERANRIGGPPPGGGGSSMSCTNREETLCGLGPNGEPSGEPRAR